MQTNDINKLMATSTINKTRTYKDLDLTFTKHPVRKDVSFHFDEYAVINSIKNLVLTNHYERPFQPEIGSNVRRLLFENVDVVVAAQLEREISEVIDNFEPRASVSRVTAVPAPDENGYSIELEFFLVNNPSPVSINFFLKRVR
jgi:phage baseplate assembly protein W